jgi:AraC-like DNA-binding protein
MADHINYREIAPHRALSPFIDAYWTVTGDNTGYFPDKVLPDACVDIILNTGPAFAPEIGATQMDTGRAYLIGTMTRFKEMIRPPATRLTGIRFKPGGFPFFYDHLILKDTADKTVEFDPGLVPPIPETPSNLAAYLDRWFADRLTVPSQQTLTLIESIHQVRGRITVSELAKRNFVTTRQLERLFSLYLDISPKEFINVTRFQYAFDKIHQEPSRKRLLDIACECGYYDHAHLANDIKRYTGSTPSDLAAPSDLTAPFDLTTPSDPGTR